MGAQGFKADLHVHSKHSKRTSIWFLQKIGCPESYTNPLDIYRTARSRGMDLVTITDHNTLDGALEIAHLDGTFVSEEITTYFPGDGCKIHVLAWDVTERQHEDITRARENIFDLMEVLASHNIRHALAHAFYSINGRLKPGHFERLLLLFKTFEMNGAHDHFQNSALLEILQALTPALIARLADKHGITPRFEEPWRKFLVSGSDDHSSVNVARSWTGVPGAWSLDTFLSGLGARETVAKWQHSGPKTLAHNLYSIAYQYYKHKFRLDRLMEEELLLRFINHVLLPSHEEEDGLAGRVWGLMGYPRPTRLFRSQPETLKDLIQKSARDIILENPALHKAAKDLDGPDTDRPDLFFRFVNSISEKVLKECADQTLSNLSKGDFFDLFHALGSAGSLYTMLAPYFIAYNVFNRDRGLCLACKDVFIPNPDTAGRRKVRMAHFTDTLHDVNGVARTLQQQMHIARKAGKDLTLITCGPGGGVPGAVHFPSVGSFALPEYPQMRLHYPPLLQMLDYCHEQGCTHLHAATPGPVGLAALAIARILKIPIVGTYHTALPQYVAHLTGAPGLTEMTWRAMAWFYNQMDRVYVPSRATGAELAERGVVKSKIRFYERGIDVERFHPSKRNGFYTKMGLPEGEIKLLYVGRVSKEKNLPVLVEVMRELARLAPKARLVVVGDGPYLAEMRAACEGLSVTFTGFLAGEDLARAYASSDLFLFPSATDTFGNAVLEAQASGIPVIVTDMGGPRENLIAGETGTIVPAGDAGAFVSAILDIVENPALHARMRKKAREYIKDNSFEAAWMRLWESYREVRPEWEAAV
jgi:glycosyltransferase involved in cell wall biosynthesis